MQTAVSVICLMSTVPYARGIWWEALVRGLVKGRWEQRLGQLVCVLRRLFVERGAQEGGNCGVCCIVRDAEGAGRSVR